MARSNVRTSSATRRTPIGERYAPAAETAPAPVAAPARKSRKSAAAANVETVVRAAVTVGASAKFPRADHTDRAGTVGKVCQCGCGAWFALSDYASAGNWDGLRRFSRACNHRIDAERRAAARAERERAAAAAAAADAARAAADARAARKSARAAKSAAA